MAGRQPRYRLTVCQLHDGKTTKVIEIYGSAFITAVAAVTRQGDDDIVDVHLNDAGPSDLQRLIARALADQYQAPGRPR